MLKTYSDILFELLNCPAPVSLSSKITEIHLKLTNFLSNKLNEQEEEKQKIINDPKSLEAETLKYLISFFNELPSDFYKDHISKIIRFQDLLSNGGIFNQSEKLGLSINISDISSNNHLSIYIISRLLNDCSMKELLLFFNEFILEVKGIGKKLFFLKIFGLIIEKIEKKELFLDSAFPAILNCCSGSVQKYLKLRENKLLEECGTNEADMWKNFETYAVSTLQSILKIIKKICENNRNKILYLSDIIEQNIECDEPKEKNISPEYLINHYCLLFIFDLSEGVLEAIESGKFEKKELENLLIEIFFTVEFINDKWICIVQNYLSQNRYYKFIKAKKKKINENLNKYDKYSSYNLFAVARILSYYAEKDKEFFQFYTTEYKLKLILPIFGELLKEKNPFFKKELIELIEKVIKSDEKYFNDNFGVFDNLNKFNYPLQEILVALIDMAGNYQSEEKEKSNLLLIVEKLQQLFTKEALYKLLLEMINSCTNLNLIGYLTNQYKKNILTNLDDKNNNNPSINPFINVNKFIIVVEKTISKDSFTSISLKTELINEVLNLIIFVLHKFINTSIEEKNNLPENHLLNIHSNLTYQNLIKNMNSLEKSITDELDSLNKKKSQLKEDKKRNIEEVNKEINNFEFKINQVLILNQNLKKILELIKMI